MQKIKALDSIQNLNLDIQTAVHSIPASERYFIALSGGLDSLALLYFCLPYLKRHTEHIHAIHIHHGLSPNADAWADFCLDVCQQLSVPCHIEKVVVATKGQGIEAEARKARYAVFKRYLLEGGVLLQGHHLNDQAETVLMRVFKGLGPEALRSIPQARVLSSGSLFRPWLSVSRESLVSSVEEAGLSWVEDESNLDSRFERNFIRHNVLPILKDRRPSILSDLARTAYKANETVEFIHEWCKANQNKFLSSDYWHYQALDLSVFREFSNIQQKFIIRFWLDLLKVTHPSESSFRRIFGELLTAQNNSQAEVCWGNYALRVFNGALFCLKDSERCKVNYESFTPKIILLDDIKSVLSINLPSGLLQIELIEEAQSDFLQTNQGLNQSVHTFELMCAIPASINEITLKYRSGGEKIYLHQKHSSTLKKLYQTNKVLPWLRNSLPLIYAADELICSLAGFVADSCQLNSSGKLSATDSRLVRFSFEMR